MLSLIFTSQLPIFSFNFIKIKNKNKNVNLNLFDSGIVKYHLLKVSDTCLEIVFHVPQCLACVYECMRVSEALELTLQTCVSCQSVPGTEPGSSARAAGALNYGAYSQVPCAPRLKEAQRHLLLPCQQVNTG